MGLVWPRFEPTVRVAVVDGVASREVGQRLGRGGGHAPRPLVRQGRRWPVEPLLQEPIRPVRDLQAREGAQQALLPPRHRRRSPLHLGRLRFKPGI